MLRVDMVEKATNSIKIYDYNSTVVRHVLDYMYAGYIKANAAIDYETVIAIASFGQQFDIRGLVKAAFEILIAKANVLNIFDMIREVEQAKFDDKELRRNLLQYALT